MSSLLVIDASVALKWRFRDEDETETAINLLSDALTGKVELVAPALWIYEITNALRTAVVRKRLNESAAIESLTHLLQVEVRLIMPDTSRFQSILTDAILLQNSAYDASYINLAEQLGCGFYTGDRKLYEAVQDTYAFVYWIGDYQGT